MRPVDRRDVMDALRTWGELVRQYGDATPEGWGWPSSSIEWRMGKGRGGESEFTMPEAAVLILQRRGYAKDMAVTIARIFLAMPYIQSMVLALKYVHDLDEASIKMQTGASERELRRHVESGEETIFRALQALRKAA